MSFFVLPVLVALVLCFVPYVRHVGKIVTTVVHELGHAVVVMPFGGRLRGVKIRASAEGEAGVSLPRYPFPFYQILRVLNLFAGYSAPLYLGLFFFVAVLNGWVTGLNVVFVVMSVLMLFFVRNWFGVLVAVGFAGVNGLFVFLFPGYLTSYAVCFGVVLFVRGVTDVVNAGKWTFGGHLKSSDFVLASDELSGSPKLWFVLFLLFHSALFFTVVMLLNVYGLLEGMTGFEPAP